MRCIDVRKYRKLRMSNSTATTGLVISIRHQNSTRTRKSLFIGLYQNFMILSVRLYGREFETIKLRISRSATDEDPAYHGKSPSKRFRVIKMTTFLIDVYQSE